MPDKVDADRLSRLIGDIYDAALHPSLWINALEQASKFVGGAAASLFTMEGSSGGAVHYVYGVEPRYQQLYFQRYISLDPHNAGYLTANILEPFAATDFVPFSQLEHTAFYQEWVRPQSWIDCIGVVLDRSMFGLSMFGVFRHERDGFVDSATRDRMRLLLPHIRRATLIGRTFERQSAEADTLADTLDAIRAAVFVVDAAGRIVHANKSGHEMAERGPVRIVRGHIMCCRADEDNAMRKLLAMAVNGDQALGTQGISLYLCTDAGEQYVAHVLSLCSGRRRKAGATYGAAATVFIRRASVDMQSAGNIIRQAFKLTPTELRVLLGIVEIGGVPEVASALGVAEATVKTHLGRVFEKTGTARQADLVKVVGRFAGALRD